MADAQVLHAQSVAEPTSASTTWVEGASIAAGSFTTGKEYLIIAIEKIRTSAGTTDRGSRLVHGATPTEFTDADTWMDPVVSSERLSVGWLTRFTQPNPTEAIATQFNRKEGAGTITHMFSSIIAIKLSDDFTENTDFFWNEATGDVADAASMTSRAAITFTPNGRDRWLIIGQASWDIANTGVNFSMRINDSVGPANYGDDGTRGYASQDTDDLYHFMYFVAVTPSNASHTFSVQTKSAVTETVRSTRIIALNLNKFAQRANVYTAASDTPTGGSWETEATLAPTPTATGNWVIMANALASALTADDMMARLQINASGTGLASDPAYGDDAPDDVGNSISRGFPWGIMTLKSLTSGAARDINFDWTQVGGGTSVVLERALVAFPVALASTGYTLNVAAGSFALTGAAATTLKTKLLNLAAGSYAKTGQAATLARGYNLNVAAGSV